MNDSIDNSDRRKTGLAEGERRRDQAHVLLLTRRAVLIRAVQRQFLSNILDRGPMTIDAVRGLVPVPIGIDPRLVGAAVRSLALDRIIVSVGRERSQRPEAHGRWLDRWAIHDRAEAQRWLALRPDLTEEADPSLVDD